MSSASALQCSAISFAPQAAEDLPCRCRARTAAEAQKHLKRRRKRKREKAGLDGEDPSSKAEDELAASDELVAMQASTRDLHKQLSDGEKGRGLEFV